MSAPVAVELRGALILILRHPRQSAALECAVQEDEDEHDRDAHQEYHRGRG